MTPIFLDSAYIIALVNERDKYHTQARSLARRYRDRPLVISEGVLLEIGNALAGRFRLKAAQIIEQILGSSRIEVIYTSPRLMILALALYKQMADKQWGLVDCISFVIMREQGISEALTADHHFVQAGFRALFTRQN